MPHQPPQPPPGLRERKRIETRQRIADTASLLFMTRGFEAVTVAEIAAAADVSKVTVFNYFPRKEDMFFDRQPEAQAMLTAAVEDRAPGRTPLAAIGELMLDLVDTAHPLAGVGPGYQIFMNTVRSSPTLRARAREALDELEDALTELFTAAGGPLAGPGPAPPGAADARVAAGLLVGAARAVYRTMVRRQLAGEPPAALAAPYRAALQDALSRVERAVAGGT